uniref:Uncharacterized protein n=1 Tax=Romanomermis culicivorax TaxID=13658 RepID=A0A915J0Q5_ROMCU
MTKNVNFLGASSHEYIFPPKRRTKPTVTILLRITAAATTYFKNLLPASDNEARGTFLEKISSRRFASTNGNKATPCQANFLPFKSTLKSLG